MCKSHGEEDEEDGNEIFTSDSKYLYLRRRNISSKIYIVMQLTNICTNEWWRQTNVPRVRNDKWKKKHGENLIKMLFTWKIVECDTIFYTILFELQRWHCHNYSIFHRQNAKVFGWNGNAIKFKCLNWFADGKSCANPVASVNLICYTCMWCEMLARTHHISLMIWFI